MGRVSGKLYILWWGCKFCGEVRENNNWKCHLLCSVCFNVVFWFVEFTCNPFGSNVGIVVWPQENGLLSSLLVEKYCSLLYILYSRFWFYLLKYIFGIEFCNGFCRWNSPNLISPQGMLGNTWIFTLLTLCKITVMECSLHCSVPYLIPPQIHTYPVVLKSPISRMVSLTSPNCVHHSLLHVFNVFCKFYFTFLICVFVMMALVLLPALGSELPENRDSDSFVSVAPVPSYSSSTWLLVKYSLNKIALNHCYGDTCKKLW